ncbi:malate dehydrogenase [Methanocorpusculum vombati]|uniref:malate dehydrogenase n=1 Tax=Methanocorpusculum vombati TaxID=3002864 RepID=A0ABT4ILU9_9EURY|nr:lactate dehydrogenase [Methanocorpusculum vombati]MCZ9320087.1 lactate dehydrogenase [Methanocorpusculum sp.]MCZ0862734.1 lactate dehydrogenase [Methanocorpusculum vombati]MDE2520657.1 lactate dehydrogenase [Methanocorpusculum sp.]MDE2534194.1 lactate dehydrogenase [Methanocorpusculum sp.]MDE2545686.1 lactate dehydrogenase [Methanocorpusculum sp.]
MTVLACLGAGRIGGEVAFLAAALGLADEIILHDMYEPVLTAQKLDITHAIDIPVSCDTKRLRDADYCVFSAGAARTPEIKTRADLFDANLPVAREAADMLSGFGGHLIVVTNPMDVFTWYFAKHTGLAQEQVLGFGGLLDSRRFSLALASAGVTGDARVLGEHGEHQVPVFSRLPISVPDTVREEILADIRGSSMPVIKGKSGTIFGPAWHICSMLNDIRTDSHRLITCSVPADGAYNIDGCALGLPVTLGRNGAAIDDSWTFDHWEETKLREAADYLTGLCRRV